MVWWLSFRAYIHYKLKVEQFNSAKCHKHPNHLSKDHITGFLKLNGVAIVRGIHNNFVTQTATEASGVNPGEIDKIEV